MAPNPRTRLDPKTRFAWLASLLAAGVAFASSQAAAGWVERPFDPAVGSRWIIQEDHTEEDNDNGTIAKSTKSVTSEMTIEAKIAEGFRLTYMRSASSFTGDPEDTASSRAALAALQGIRYVVITNAAGKPLRVENFGEAVAARKRMTEAVAATAADPQTKAIVQKVFADFANLDPASAAASALDELPTLAIGQNTGLKIGAAKTSATAEQSGFAAIGESTTLSIVDADEATGEVHLTLAEVSDPESMRAMLLDIYGRMRADDPEGVDAAIAQIKRMTLSQENRTDFDVVGGMTRRMDISSTTSRALGSDRRVVTSRTVVSVSPAP